MIDFCNSKSAVKLENAVDLVIQQIDMLLGTDPQEVLGSPWYGSDYHKFIWDLNYKNAYIEAYIRSHLTTNVDFLGLKHNEKVTILRGTESDIILVTISILADDEVFEKTYNIQ